MNNAKPTFDDIFAVMASASVGDLAARVTIPAEPDVQHVETRFAIALNILLDDLAHAAQHEVSQSEEQRARLAAIVDSSDDAMISKTMDGTITTWNHGAELLLGYTADQIVGKSIYQLVPPGRETEEATILKSLALGAVMHLDTVRRRADGTDVEVSITVSPVRDEMGTIVGISDVERDITERVRAARVLAQAKDEAEAANRELETFSYSVAHDLRAPLRGMNGFAHLLLDEYSEQLDDQARGWLKGIQRNATRMAELIDGLLSLSRVTQAELSPTMLDLSALANEAVSQLAAVDSHRTVTVDIADGLSEMADARLVRVLFMNLFSNAWKFTGKTQDARIVLGTTGHEYFVRDNGAGFDPAFASKLFQPFHRLHDAKDFPGTGIGLATVQRIVHRHGGTIRAEGSINGGATFYFTLSAAAVAG